MVLPSNVRSPETSQSGARGVPRVPAYRHRRSHSRFCWFLSEFVQFDINSSLLLMVLTSSNSRLAFSHIANSSDIGPISEGKRPRPRMGWFIAINLGFG